MKRLSAGLLVIFSVAAHAATPDAGTILQQAQPPVPQVPLPDSTGLTVEKAESAKLPTSAPFDVKLIEISGNTLFATANLHALIAEAEGKPQTLDQLKQLAERITNYYHQHGYLLARAYVPLQTIKDGLVRFEVLEARYGNINLDNQSKVTSRLLDATLAPLKSGQPIFQPEMDKSLLLLSDIPGVVVGATLKPGETVGTSDLVVGVKPGVPYYGNVALDNYGNQVTGRNRIGANFNYLNPFAHGDVVSVNMLSSGTNMNYGRLSYETLLTGKGTRAGGAYSTVHYILGDTFASLNGHGTANVESLWLKQPLIRKQNFNVYTQLQYDLKKLDERIDIAAINTQRHLDNVTLSISGDERDSFLNGGVSTWSLGYTSGRVVYEDTTAQKSDAQTANTAGSFSKLTVNLSRLQDLTRGHSLYVNIAAQWANSNLDSSEKMIAGGPYSVRAYNMGAISGDSGYSETIELRHDVNKYFLGQWQAVAFVESAQVTVNHMPWTTGTNTATLSGAGVGLNWFGPKQFSARGYIAKPIGATPDLVADAGSVRAWLVLNKAF
jgi:hemolysin activation/secretion protein